MTAVNRNAALVKKSVEGAKGFWNLGALREAAKLNGINDVPKWLKAMHQTYDQYVESQVWTARFEKLKSGEPLRPRIPNIMLELVASFDWTPKQPWN